MKRKPSRTRHNRIALAEAMEAYRLALSGTPVENHLAELWSLFEFLNPGMLGEAKVLKLAGGLARNPSEEDADC
jgi:SNF2 family DNA or RNA helicase